MLLLAFTGVRVARGESRLAAGSGFVLQVRSVKHLIVAILSIAVTCALVCQVRFQITRPPVLYNTQGAVGPYYEGRAVVECVAHIPLAVPVLPGDREGDPPIAVAGKRPAILTL